MSNPFSDEEIEEVVAIPTSERVVKMKIEYYKDDAKEWRWRAIADNGKIVADSAEGYKHRIDAAEEVQQLKSDFPNALEVIEDDENTH